MNLYSLTLQQTTGIQKAIYGNFSASKAQEVVVSKVKHVELLRWNEQTGKLQSVLQQEIFGLIRCIQTFRLPGSNRDQIVIGTDSGKVVILSYDGEKNVFNKVHQETYGKSGSRRIVPGQYLACDPKGRAFMLSAVEKNKFVYILNRENEKLSISSPLEAPKSHTIVFDIIGLDAGYDNAMFAALEVDYGDWQDKDSCVNTGERIKFLTIYEMDFGLNTVKRRTSDPIEESAHQLLSVPFAPDGPGGVIVLCEDFLIYRGTKGGDRKVPYPRRIGAPGDRGVLIGAVGFHKQKDRFLYMLQNEFGDIFEMQFHFTHEEVHNITLQYFDTIPVAVSLCIMRGGLLFAPCERGNHNIYRFLALGKDEKNPVITDATMKQDDLVYFAPRKLTNLTLEDEIQNFSCITQVQVADLINEGNPQIYTLCAAGSRSTLRVLRHGLGITQLANTNLPGKPLAIWTIKTNQNDEFHKYIILSFLNQTLVLSIGQKVEETHDSGLENSRQSLHIGLLEDNSIVQVISNGIRHVRKNQTPHNFLVEGKVIKACSNPRQVALGLAGGDLYYYELDASGLLVEIAKEKMDHEITSLELGQIEEGRQRCRLLAVGLSDHTVRLVSLDPEACLEKIAIQALPSLAESLCMMEMMSQDYGTESATLSTTQTFLFMGLNNGVLLRSTVDSLTGQLSDTRTRYLGTKQVKCFRVQANGSSGMLALSSRPWLCYNHTQKIFMQPLSYDYLDYAASFNTKDFIGGIVGISGSTLRIIAPERYGELFNQSSINLSYSPRKLVVHEESKNIVLIESDNRAYCYRERQEKKLELFGDNPELLNVPDSQIGSFAPMYQWAACCRLFDPKTLSTIQLHEFENNEHAVSVTFLQFAGYEEQYLCVGTVKDLLNEPCRQFTEGYIHTFTITQGGRQMNLLHSTPIDEVPYALAAWRGRLLVGAGCHLRVYEMGKKRLLKKAELKNLNSFVTQIHVHHDRIFVTELSDSVHLLRYRIKDQTFMELADDILPRWVSASCLVDYHTIVASDKFENIYVTRVPLDIDEEQEEHPFEFKMKMDQGCMNGAPFKMDQICNFYYGEVITTLTKAALVSTGNEVIVFGTSLGSIGALFPFDSKEDIDFFLHLEMYLRIESVPISGRDHMMYRSFYGPCKVLKNILFKKNVIDGDLCEQFSQLPYAKQKQMSEEFDRTPADIMKKLEDIRYKIL